MSYETVAYQKTHSQEILARKDIYQYYLTEVASARVLAKNDKGKRACFCAWKRCLKKYAEAQL